MTKYSQKDSQKNLLEFHEPDSYVSTFCFTVVIKSKNCQNKNKNLRPMHYKLRYYHIN